MPTTIVHSHSLESEIQNWLNANIPGELSVTDNYCRIEHDLKVNREILDRFRQQFSIDINTLPEDFKSNQVSLVLSDMDSTLISIECVDEIADFINIKQQVAAITESAMRGEIDFNASLQKRVGLLKGVDVQVLESVYNERLTLNPGAEQLVEGLHKLGITTALVSGGFTFFTDRLKQKLNLSFTLSNVLEIQNGKLTGNVVGSIVNAEVKADFLKRLAEQQKIGLDQTIAIGDGANDLKMMGLAGLGVAYRAKPKVQLQADAVLNYSNLDAILHFIHAKKG